MSCIQSVTTTKNASWLLVLVLKSVPPRSIVIRICNVGTSNVSPFKVPEKTVVLAKRIAKLIITPNAMTRGSV